MMNLSNGSWPDEEEETLYDPPVSLVVFLSLCYGSISIAAVVGNGLVIWVILTSRRMRNVTNYYIANLALADIVIGLFAIPFEERKLILLDGSYYILKTKKIAGEMTLVKAISAFKCDIWERHNVLKKKCDSNDFLEKFLPPSKVPILGIVRFYHLHKYLIIKRLRNNPTIRVCLNSTKFQAALLQRWVLPHFLCPFCPFIKVLSISVSVLTLSAIALDRYRAIIHPLTMKSRKQIDDRTQSMPIQSVVDVEAISSSTSIISTAPAEDVLTPSLIRSAAFILLRPGTA
uniref:G_PROTEIN_RECEP_F1_2 domain-containing protein n=1 Tax=Rhodnius prolixus TaxID=13249 RepID=T1HX00_RHOPR